MTLNSEGHGTHRAGVRGVRLRAEIYDEGLRFSSLDKIPEPELDVSGLSDYQAHQAKELAQALDKKLIESMQSYVGESNEALEKQRFADKMKETIEKMVSETDTSRIRGVDLNIDDLLRSIDPNKLLQRTFEVCNYDNILAMLMKSMGRQPTMNAVHRTIDFISSTTHSSLSQRNYDLQEHTDAIKQHDTRPHHEQEIEALMNQLSQLIFVSKARLILNDYPESISISVQMSPSIDESDTESAMQAFEDVLTDFKPKGLIELEVSITNKVVY